MTRNGKDRLAAALGESYPRVWRGLGLEAKIARNLPDIQDKKRPREMTGPVIPTWRARRARPTRGKNPPPATRSCHPPPESEANQLGQHAVLPLPRDSATGSDTFSIPNEVRPHCACGRVADASLPEQRHGVRHM